jgi:hypothetical protein
MTCDIKKVDAIEEFIETNEEIRKQYFLLGVEYGYRQCEKGHNIQQTKSNAEEFYIHKER